MKPQETLLRFVVALVLLCAVCARVAGQAAPPEGRVVWQIGEFDGTSREFGHDFHTDNPAWKPMFTIGQSKPADL